MKKMTKSNYRSYLVRKSSFSCLLRIQTLTTSSLLFNLNSVLHKYRARKKRKNSPTSLQIFDPVKREAICQMCEHSVNSYDLVLWSFDSVTISLPLSDLSLAETAIYNMGQQFRQKTLNPLHFCLSVFQSLRVQL